MYAAVRHLLNPGTRLPGLCTVLSALFVMILGRRPPLGALHAEQGELDWLN